MATPAAADLPKSSAVYSPVTQPVNPAIKPVSHLSVLSVNLSAPSASQPACPVQSACHFCQPSCQPVCQPICRSRQSVSQSVGQLVRSHGRSSPSALVPSRGSVAVEAEGRRGREEPGGRTLTWRRTQRGFCGRRSRGSGGRYRASVASQGRRRDSEKEGRLDQTASLPLPGLQ